MRKLCYVHCYTTGKLGDLEEECRKKQAMQTGQVQRCFNCKKFGHLAKSVYAVTVVLHAVVAATLAAAVSAWWCERLAALIAPFSFQCIYQGRVP